MANVNQNTEMTWSMYWNQIVELAEQDSIVISDIDKDRIKEIKDKFKSLWKKGIEVFDAYERLVEMF